MFCGWRDQVSAKADKEELPSRLTYSPHRNIIDLECLKVGGQISPYAPKNGWKLPFNLLHFDLASPIAFVPPRVLSALITSSISTITSLSIGSVDLATFQWPSLDNLGLLSIASRITSLHLTLAKYPETDSTRSLLGTGLREFPLIANLTLEFLQIESISQILRALPSGVPTITHLTLRRIVHAIPCWSSSQCPNFSNPKVQREWIGCLRMDVLKKLEVITWGPDTAPCATSREMAEILRGGRDVRMEWEEGEE
ncbi:hypothetical protein P7C70_g1245, partial [Phenoliferia sp. Uapishka_3]